MISNAFHLKYQCRTTGKLIKAKKLADQNYSVLIKEKSEPQKISAYSMRKNFKFVKNEKPRINLKIKGNK